MRWVSRAAKVAASSILVLCACGGSTSATPAAHAALPEGARASALPALPEAPFEAQVAEAATRSDLPSAPWATPPIASEAAPGAVLAAWRDAENRSVCAPIAPIATGAADGAEARVSTLIEGGWAVEFDRRGMPGMSERGAECRRCGRGVFGVAGTRMSPDELVMEESADESGPTFADGSQLVVDPPADGESIASATLTVRGQGCVYQVWSHLGEEHVRELVSALRVVDVNPAPVASAR
ncbi:MAG: hypothetical protein AB7S26_23120 [Sandaracinaceae bacterium]